VTNYQVSVDAKRNHYVIAPPNKVPAPYEVIYEVDTTQEGDEVTIRGREPGEAPTGLVNYLQGDAPDRHDPLGEAIAYVLGHTKGRGVTRFDLSIERHRDERL
jgi:hypothetical protein